ncbi:MAG: hypothetical protein LBC75_08975 [Fibromonadaceae bacterium]|jgi:hypothetical protein|nr:hypothetical protein [Fibromonadaceae bacterium]
MATATAEIETLTATEVKRAMGTLRLGNWTEDLFDKIKLDRKSATMPSKIHNDYENDAIEIPVVKKMRFKFNKPTKVEFV